jgi:PAS domain S-box-containing protein
MMWWRHLPTTTVTIRVLHVDDDPEYLETTREVIERTGGFEVVNETDADAGLERFEENDIDCIVTDYRMPGTDGLEFLQRLRERDPNVPFFLFTGRGSEEVASEAISAGVTDYIQKGGMERYEMLAQRVRAAIERRRAEDRAARGQRLLEKLAEHTTDVILLVEPDGEPTFVSGSVTRVLGYTPEDVRKRGLFALAHPDDRGFLRRQFERRLQGEGTTEISYRMVRRDGSVVRVRTRTYDRTDDPDVGGVLVYSRPATGNGDDA